MFLPTRIFCGRKHLTPLPLCAKVDTHQASVSNFVLFPVLPVPCSLKISLGDKDSRSVLGTSTKLKPRTEN